jgi:hypothetical protein
MSVVTAVLTGCSMSSVRFTNVSDTWLNVSFFVGTSEIESKEPEDLFRRKSIQVEPGETARYRPMGDLVHIRVQPVGPTWVPTGGQAWVELMTLPPIHVVASGRPEKLEFQSFHGEIALIPQREIDAGRYVYHREVKPAPAKRPKPADPTQVSDAPTDQPSWED